MPMMNLRVAQEMLTVCEQLMNGGLKTATFVAADANQVFRSVSIWCESCGNTDVFRRSSGGLNDVRSLIPDWHESANDPALAATVLMAELSVVAAQNQGQVFLQSCEKR